MKYSCFPSLHCAVQNLEEWEHCNVNDTAMFIWLLSFFLKARGSIQIGFYVQNVLWSSILGKKKAFVPLSAAVLFSFTDTSSRRVWISHKIYPFRRLANSFSLFFAGEKSADSRRAGREVEWGEMFEKCWIEHAILPLLCVVLLGHGDLLEEEVTGTMPTTLAVPT